MSILKKTVQVGLLALGCLVTVATSREPEPVIIIDETWLIANLFDGRTAVPTDYDIELAIGWRDFDEYGDTGRARRRAEKTLEHILLYPADNPDDLVELSLNIEEETTILEHEGLDEDTEYVLDLTEIEDGLVAERPIPDPIAFSTVEGPRVTGLWMNGDTLFVVFSEPMDSSTLSMALGSVDVLWSEDGELHSIAMDLNLANFVWEADEFVFRAAPVDFGGQLWVKVSGNVRGESGAYLDGNGNGVPGEVDDDFLEEITLSDLETCHTREDIPDPCVRFEDLPDEWEWEWEM